MSIDRKLLRKALPAYDIGDELGEGGMGVVVSGQHRQLDRRVAIKQLPLAVATDQDMRRRFMSEARLLASVDHPHVVPVYDFVESGGVCLLVMELLPGGTLRSRVAAAGSITAQYAVAVTLACLSGLSAAHRRGVLHRDIKPENMLFASSGVLKVTDFGIAKVVGAPGTVLTRVGQVIGTPAYIAPEQVRGGQLSPATDVYMVATMLYELLAGVLPFPEGGDQMAVMFRHAYEEPVPLLDAAPGVPEPVGAAVMRGLETAPADRFGTAESFGVALAEAGAQAWGPGWLSAEPVPIMDAGPILAAAAGHASVSGSAVRAAPTIAAAHSVNVPPVPGKASAPGKAPTAEPAAAGLAAAKPGTADIPGAVEEASAGAAQPASRRRIMIYVVVAVVVIVLAILAIVFIPHLFKVYPSTNSGIAPWHGLARRAARA
jgi:Protein kinase domain